MKPKTLYLLFAIAGFVAPYYFLLSFLFAHGVDPALFLQQLLGTPISSFFATDLVISSLVFILYLRREAARSSIRPTWPYVVALFTVGLSFALPLFLYFRELNRDGKPSIP